MLGQAKLDLDWLKSSQSQFELSLSQVELGYT